MASPSDPNFCAICDDGLLKRTNNGGRRRVGKIELASADAAREMQGRDEKKREAQRGFAIKVGLCLNCIDDHDLGTDQDGSLSDVYDQISLSRTVFIADRDH